MLLAAEPDKHRPMLIRRPKWGVAAEDMPLDAVFFDVRARDGRLGAAHLFVQLDTRRFGPPDDLLLRRDREGFESGDIVGPLLHQDDSPTGAGGPLGIQAYFGRLGEPRILS